MAEQAVSEPRASASGPAQSVLAGNGYQSVRLGSRGGLTVRPLREFIVTNQPEAVGASPALDCLSGGGEMGFIEQIVELTPVVITVFDVVGERDIYVSRDVPTLIGLTRDEVLQMKDPVSTVWHPDDVPRYSGLLARWKRLADGEISEFRFRARRGEG